MEQNHMKYGYKVNKRMIRMNDNNKTSERQITCQSII